MRLIIFVTGYMLTIVQAHRSGHPHGGEMTVQEFVHLAECVLTNSAAVQGGYEDMNLLPLVRWAAGRRAGKFVELGAHDGFSGSTTWTLEKCFGWTGVLIEALPSTCSKLQASNRPRSTKFCCAVCPEGRTVHMSGFDATRREGNFKGGSSAVTGVVEFMTTEYRKTWNKLLDTENTEEVKCRPMTSLLVEAGVSEVDFLSLDTQGSEDVVLGTADLRTVKVVLVEAESTSKEKNQRVRSMLHDAGFIQIEHNQQPQKSAGGAQYNELYAQSWLVKPHMNYTASPARWRNFPPGEPAILYPLRTQGLSSFERYSRLARFADGLLAMDAMTAAVRAPDIM